MKVLVIDDDRGFVEMVRSVLAEDGHVVVAASDGKAGLEAAARATPDVILLDLLMPRLDGPTFASSYARAPGRHAPIIVLSGVAGMPGSAVAGASAYLSKPFELDALLGTLRRVVS
jgi:CheY-like chemotaxis protein